MKAVPSRWLHTGSLCGRIASVAIATLIGPALAPAGFAQTAASAEERRPARTDHRHRIARPPAEGEVPEILRRSLPRRPFPPAPDELDQEATAAGRWAAEEISRGPGRRSFYRAGFYDGTHLALETLPDFPDDYADGLRDGARDPGALAHGQAAGMTAAGEIARQEAARRTETQFMDLSAEPLFDARAATPLWTPAVTGIEPPPLDETFRAIVAPHVPGLSPTWEHAFGGWRLDPWELHRCQRYEEFLDQSWTDPGSAFDLWMEAPRRSASYRKLQHPPEKQRFREVFQAAYAARLAMLYDEELAVSYRIGRGDGWTWGAIAVAEWRYGSGYAEGFHQAALTAAAAAYAASFPGAYERHYDDQFKTWLRSSVPGIHSFRVEDASDDGIFQPGEAIRAWVEVANYGGIPGEWRAVISSDVLASAGEALVQVPPRRVTSVPAPVELRIRPEVERGRRSSIEVSLGDLRLETPLLVSYPLSLTGTVRLATLDVPAGRAVAEVEVRNAGRKPVSGDLALVRQPALDAQPASVRLEGLLPGETRTAAFRLEGVDPLSALSGDVELGFELTSGEMLHDELRWSFPPIAVDLESGEMERFLVSLASEGDADGAAIRAAIDLTLRRLAADWSAAVEGSGNPYKHDFQERDGTTALGKLVRAYHRESARMRSPEIFERLGEEIESFADELPGPHPFLRKYLVRLARQLG